MHEVVRQIGEAGVVLVVRGESAEAVIPGIEAVVAGGVNVVEITFTVPDAPGVIRRVNEAMGKKILLGAGTVMTPLDAVTAVNAGARFVVAPNTNPEVIGMCKSLDVPIAPGALSPTEVAAAWAAGAEIVKLFPASAVGPAYLRAIHAPMPEVRLLPTGGVDAKTAGEYIKNGAFALGVGGKLFDKKLLAAKKYDEMTARARELIAAVKAAREG